MTNWAIVVGIDEYPARSGLRPLHGAVADACDFADWVLDKDGGAVLPENLFFWTHPWPKQATARLKAYLKANLPKWEFDLEGPTAPDERRAPRASEIVDTIQKAGRTAYFAAQEANDLAAQRRAYVFLAGHGVRAKETLRPDYQTCFVAGNFRPGLGDNIGGVVACASLREALFSARFNEVLLFLDCCRVEVNILPMSVAAISDPRLPPCGDIWGIGQAAQDEKPAYELDGPPVRGAFTKVLVEGLRHYREPLSGELRISGVEQYVLKNIESRVDRPQIPQFDSQKPPRDPLILKGEPTAKPGPLLNLAGLPAGEEVVLKDGTLSRVAVVPPLIANPNPIQLPILKDGLYIVELVSDPTRRWFFSQPIDRTVDAK